MKETRRFSPEGPQKTFIRTIELNSWKGSFALTQSRDQEERLKGKIGTNQITIQVDKQRSLIMSSDDLEIFHPDRPLTISQTSDAVYFAKRIIEDKETGEKTLFLVQYLPGGFHWTSHHRHPYAKELFLPLSDNLLVFHEGEVKQVADEGLYVQQNESHMCFTLEYPEPSVTLLIQTGTSFNHDYLDKPNFEALSRQKKLLNLSLPGV